MIFWQSYLQGLAFILLAMTALWALSVRLRDASIVDPFWGSSFVLLAWFYNWQTTAGNPTRSILITALTTLWGLRLSLYLLWRNWGEGEDFRYRQFRQKYGPDRYWWVSFFQVFLLQGILAWLISAPLLGAQIGERPFSWLDGVAIGVWTVGFIFEAGGDWQLACFKANPAHKGQLLTSGFWRYTRHPNYFGDAAVWWGYGLLTIAAGAPWPLLGSLLMTFLLLRVSGVALLEKSLAKDKPGYEAYQTRTSAFIPWFPKQP